MFIDFGDMRLPVAVDAADQLGQPVPKEARRTLANVLRKLAADEDSMVQYLERPDRAEWLVRWEEGGRRKGEGGIRLVSALSLPPSTFPLPPCPALPSLFGPAARGAQLADWLRDRLRRIAKARNLLRLASDPDETARGAAVKVGIEFRLLKNKSDPQGEPLPLDGRGIRLHDDDHLRVRLRNPNPFPIDVTLLYVDSGYGIAPFYPRPGEINRLPPNGVLSSLRLHVVGDTLGLEHLVAIAVRAADNQAVDFSLLAQPTLEKGREIDSPLGRLLRHAMFGQGVTRGITPEMTNDYSIQVHSWRILPEKRRKP